MNSSDLLDQLHNYIRTQFNPSRFNSLQDNQQIRSDSSRIIPYRENFDQNPRSSLGNSLRKNSPLELTNFSFGKILRTISIYLFGSWTQIIFDLFDIFDGIDSLIWRFFDS